MKPRKIIIDCDPGIGIAGVDADDPLALCLAIASEEVDLIGVTTVFGNVSAKIATQGALKVLMEASRTNIPVAMGMELPLGGKHAPEVARAYQNGRGRPGKIELPGVEGKISPLHAADFIIEQVHRYPKEVDILLIGPQTNLALALLKDPTIAEEIGEIVFMGGAMGREPIYGRGNVTSVAELNIWHDPLAAQIVFESGIPITMVGLDITNPNKGTVMYEDVIEQMKRSSTRTGKFLYEVCSVYLEAPMFHGTGRRKGCILYDPMAVAAYIDRSLVTTERMRIAVEHNGLYTAGQTLELFAADEEKQMEVCVEVDGRRATDFICERLLSLC